MAIVVRPQPSFGELLGTGLGAGLQKGIEQREQRIERTKMVDLLKGLNIPEEEAQFIAAQPPALQYKYLQALGQTSALEQPQLQQPPEQTQALQAFEKDPGFRQFVEQHPEYQKLIQAQQPTAAAPQQPAVQQPIQPPQRPEQPLPERKRPSLVQALGTRSPELQKQQAQIENKNAPFLTNLTKRYQAAEEVISAATEMKNLLKSGNVISGPSGLLPVTFQGKDSQRFSNLSDDVANALTGLSTGVQTISKIKFNRERKPNLTQHRETQIARTNDLINEAQKIVLEEDIKDYLIKKNQGLQPRNISTEINTLYKKLSHAIPDIPEEAQEGDIFKDDDTGALWTVRGPSLRFEGF